LAPKTAGFGFGVTVNVPDVKLGNATVVTTTVAWAEEPAEFFTVRKKVVDAADRLPVEIGPFDPLLRSLPSCVPPAELIVILQFPEVPQPSLVIIADNVVEVFVVTVVLAALKLLITGAATTWTVAGAAEETEPVAGLVWTAVTLRVMSVPVTAALNWMLFVPFPAAMTPLLLIVQLNVTPV
jgi:hypothetical protein